MSAKIPTGLTVAEAKARFAAEGPNELPQAKSRSVLRVAVEVLKEPMLILLLAACAVYLALGDTAEAILISVLATASVAITVIQETRTERVLSALRDLTAPRAIVIRNGCRQHIPSREVVRGDMLVLSEGDRIPADATLMSGDNVKVDESLLTGESVPVRKGPPGKEAPPGREPQEALFSGTLIVAGTGYARVTATGVRSEIGKIGKSLSGITPEAPRLQLQIRGFVRIFAAVGMTLCVIAAVLYGFVSGEWLKGALGGLALSLSLLPEEFPVILTVFLAMGAWRISQVRVLTRKAAAIETLGSATVLCTDKTGTLTENRMTVAELRTPHHIWRAGEANGEWSEWPEAISQVLQHSVWASQINPFDPMERALHDLGRQNMESEAKEAALLRTYPVTPELPAMTQLWDFKAEGYGPDGSYLAAAKGAPEAIASLCKLGEAEHEAMRQAVDDMASRGMRVLAVARAEIQGANGADTQHGFAFAYLGLVGLRDPLKPSVSSAVRECHTAGIRVVMITGDYPVTARVIAREAGILGDGVLTGAEIDELDDDALTERVANTTVFARVRPQQKLRIVNALKARGEIVAMTGDGVNDAPSLKAAHIGVAMGGRGTDVAREASSIVLLDDDFKSIVATVRLGRRIYDNLRKAMTFVAAIHIPIAGLAFLPLLFGLPLILLPAHIAFLEMIIDPVSSIAFEAEPDERNLMNRPPRDPKAMLISSDLLKQAALQGGGAFIAVAAIFLLALYEQRSEDEARSLAFLMLVLVNMVLVFVNRSFISSAREELTRPNRTLWAVIAVDTLLLGALFAIPDLRGLFSFAPLHGRDIVIALSLVAALFLGLTMAKRAFGDGKIEGAAG